MDGGHKFDFRIYMMVVSVDPLIVYYHDGFLRVSLFKYDKHDVNRKAHLTNTELAKEIFKKVEEEGGTHMGMDIDQLREFQMRTLPVFQEYLTRKGEVSDPNWVENKLKYDFKSQYVHLVSFTPSKFILSDLLLVEDVRERSFQEPSFVRSLRSRFLT